MVHASVPFHWESCSQCSFASHTFYDSLTMSHQDFHPAEGIEAIAARIHDRALQLAAEQEALRSAEEELHKAKEELAKEETRRQRVRMEFLKRMSQANAVELECIQIRERIQDRISKTKLLKKKEKELAARVLENAVAWEKAEDALTRHKVLQEMYLKIASGVVNKRNQNLARRQSRIETVAQLCENIKREKEFSEAEQIRIQENILRMIESEDDENKAVEKMASKVREAIARVSVRFSHALFYAIVWFSLRIPFCPSTWNVFRYTFSDRNYVPCCGILSRSSRILRLR
jgi:chromosome segregation ATPase